MRIAKYFQIQEFEKANSATRLALPASINKIPADKIDNIKQLARNLDILREHFGVPITITSGYRSEEYNAGVGGAKNSQHKLGKAADIQVKGVEPNLVFKTIGQLIEAGVMDQGGLGLYHTFVHYDIRGKKARWFA